MPLLLQLAALAGVLCMSAAPVDARSTTGWRPPSQGGKDDKFIIFFASKSVGSEAKEGKVSTFTKSTVSVRTVPAGKGKNGDSKEGGAESE